MLYIYYLHRGSKGEPGIETELRSMRVTYMDQDDSTADFEPCFKNRATSVLAAFRPLGLWPSTTAT